MRKYHILYIVTIISILFIYTNNVSALSYQSDVGIGFTFNPTLSISLSSSDLVIDNLVPGSTEDSNVINVSVLTNASHGYTLAVNTNNKNLVHNDSNVDSVFSSIATNANLSSLEDSEDNNIWGYSYKLSNSNNSSNNGNNNTNSAWSTYNGLPLVTNTNTNTSTNTNTATTLVDTDNQTSKLIDFKIAAKASSTQPSGIYTGTINFIAVSKLIPKTIEDIVYMQTFSELLPTDLQTVKDSMLQEHTYILKDARDEQEYTIAKLKDNKIWMTKNLNLAGGTEITSELSDVPENYTLPIENGFQAGNKLPASSQEGFSDNAMAYVYNTNNNTDNCASPGCYSYYSWIAATAGSEAAPTASAYALYSICPKGWELPTRNIFNSLISEYSDFYSRAGINTVPNFILSGQLTYGTGTFVNGDRTGVYWTGTKRGGINVLSYLYFDANSVNTSNGAYARDGLAVRCIAR